MLDLTRLKYLYLTDNDEFIDVINKQFPEIAARIEGALEDVLMEDSLIEAKEYAYEALNG